jgi:hypothetical protein
VAGAWLYRAGQARRISPLKPPLANTRIAWLPSLSVSHWRPFPKPPEFPSLPKNLVRRLVNLVASAALLSAMVQPAKAPGVGRPLVQLTLAASTDIPACTALVHPGLPIKGAMKKHRPEAGISNQAFATGGSPRSSYQPPPHRSV